MADVKDLENEDSSVEEPADDEIDPSIEIGEFTVEHEVPIEKIPPQIMEKLLPGEKVKHERTGVQDGNVDGSVYITNFRVFFLQTKDHVILNEIPNISIWRLKKDKKSSITLEIQTKDGRLLYFHFANETQLKETFDVLFKFAYPPELNSLFAFTYKQYFLRETDAKGQDARRFTDPEVFDARKEYIRLGLTSGGYRITEANKDYKLCPTYPEVLVVPEKITDEQLFSVATFRSRGRIPAVVWRHPVNGSTISRCSQPNVGLKRHQCTEDVLLLSNLRNMPHNLHVIDSRPKTNAVANSFKGGGYEQAPYHKECFPVEFHNVENIHAVRNSLLKLYKLCKSNKPYNNKHWKSGIEETKWLDTIKSILLSAARIVELVHGKGHSVMIHCSDGWDRTAQACALSEMLMDPYYRTIEGFIVLLEKEWLTFGHQFARRAGHGANITNPNDSQRSPIFLQYVDCVWQLLQQFPTAFQFNNTFLVSLMDNLYSCQYGTFLLDCDRQRKNANIKQHTISLWYHILATKDNYVNPGYRVIDQALIPAINNLTVTLWNEYYLRFNPFANDAQQLENIIKQRMLLRQIVIQEPLSVKSTEEVRGRSETAPPAPSTPATSSGKKQKKSSKSKGTEETSPTLSLNNNNNNEPTASVDPAGATTASPPNSGKIRKKSSKKDKKKDKETTSTPRRNRGNSSSNGVEETAGEQQHRSSPKSEDHSRSLQEQSSSSSLPSSQQTTDGSPAVVESSTPGEVKKERREKRDKDKKKKKKPSSHKHSHPTPTSSSSSLLSEETAKETTTTEATTVLTPSTTAAAATTTTTVS